MKRIIDTSHISRDITTLKCRECNSPIVQITELTGRFFWCDKCQEEYNIGELTIGAS